MDLPVAVRALYPLEHGDPLILNYLLESLLCLWLKLCSFYPEKKIWNPILEKHIFHRLISFAQSINILLRNKNISTLLESDKMNEKSKSRTLIYKITSKQLNK